MSELFSLTGKRALITLRTLCTREGELDPATTKELAAALDNCGDSQLGGRVLWQLAKKGDDPAAQLELMRRACQIDSRSPYLLDFYRQLLCFPGVKTAGHGPYVAIAEIQKITGGK